MTTVVENLDAAVTLRTFRQRILRLTRKTIKIAGITLISLLALNLLLGLRFGFVSAVPNFFATSHGTPRYRLAPSASLTYWHGSRAVKVTIDAQGRRVAAGCPQSDGAIPVHVVGDS